MRDPTLGPSRDGGEYAQGLVAGGVPLHQPFQSPCHVGEKLDLHDGGEIRHGAMVLRVQRVLPRGVEPIYFGLQPGVCVRVRQQTIDDAREGDRGRVCPRDDREGAVVGEVLLGRGSRVEEVFVILANSH